MNIAIIRCKAEAKVCFGERCFASLKYKEGKFCNYPDFNIVAFIDCGGCNNISTFKSIIKELILFTKVDIIHLANCIISDSNTCFENCSQSKIYSIMKEKGKKRFNDDMYIKKRAKLIFNNQLPLKCIFKDQFMHAIKNKGVAVVEGTHGNISLVEIMTYENRNEKI